MYIKIALTKSLNNNLKKSLNNSLKNSLQKRMNKNALTKTPEKTTPFKNA